MKFMKHNAEAMQWYSTIGCHIPSAPGNWFYPCCFVFTTASAFADSDIFFVLIGVILCMPKVTDTIWNFAKGIKSVPCADVWEICL